MGGRPQHQVWDLDFKRIKENGKWVAVCSLCQEIVSNTSVDRLLIHRNKTCKTLLISKSAVKQVQYQQINSPVENQLINNEIESPIVVEVDDTPLSTPLIIHQSKKSKTSRPQKRTMDSFVDYISESQKIAIDNSLVSLFYALNIPFSAVSSKCGRVLKNK